MDPSGCWPYVNDPAAAERISDSHDYDGSISGSNTELDIITLFNGLAIWDALLVYVLVFMTFRSYRGTYFWSLLCSASGIIPHALSNIIHDLHIVKSRDGVEGIVTMAIVGWWLTVTGELVVLWSRLGLLVTGSGGARLRRWTLWMIIIGSVCLYIPTSVLAWGANIDVKNFVRGYNIMEKIQLSGFCLQELILSTIYMVLAVHYLRTSLSPRARSIMYQLFVINVILVGFDLAILILEALNLFVMQNSLKPFFYSVKLLLELAILSRLVDIVGGGSTGVSSSSNASRRSSTAPFANGSDRDKSRRTSRSGSRWGSNKRLDETDISDFVDVEKIVGDITRAVSSTNPIPGQRKILLHDGLTVSDTDVIAPRAGVTFVDADLGSRPAELGVTDRVRSSGEY